jgi:hypothetical protein
MKRLLAATILCLIATLASAQQFVPAIEIRPWFARQSLGLHDEQLNTNWQKTRIEYAAAAFLGPNLHVRYSVIPALSVSEQVQLANPLIIGTTDFFTKDDKDSKEINLDWSTRGEHRIELTGYWNFPVKPVFVGEWCNMTLTATSTKDGKDTTATEEFTRFIAAAGGMISYSATNIQSSVILVGSRELQRFEARILYRFNYSGSITGGYIQETRDLGGLKIREHGPFASILVAF